MAYVDLNSILAKMAASVESSEYISAYERLLLCKKVDVAQPQVKPSDLYDKKPLFGFIGDEIQNDTRGLPFLLLDCIELVDWSSHIIREDKRGAISSQRPRILSTLGLDNDTWLSLASRFGKDYDGAVGSLEALAAYAGNTGKRWIASKN